MGTQVLGFGLESDSSQCFLFFDYSIAKFPDGNRLNTENLSYFKNFFNIGNLRSHLVYLGYQ